MTTQERCWCGHYQRYHGGGSCTFCERRQNEYSRPLSDENPLNSTHEYSLVPPLCWCGHTLETHGGGLFEPDNHRCNACREEWGSWNDERCAICGAKNTVRGKYSDLYWNVHAENLERDYPRNVVARNYCPPCFAMLQQSLFIQEPLLNYFSDYIHSRIKQVRESGKVSVSITYSKENVALGHTGINIVAGDKAPPFAYSSKLTDKQVTAFSKSVIDYFNSEVRDQFVATTKIIV